MAELQGRIALLLSLAGIQAVSLQGIQDHSLWSTFRHYLRAISIQD